MKKLTGTILLTLALLVHVGITVATEEAYTFSSNDYENAAALRITLPNESPKTAIFSNIENNQGISKTHFGLFSIEE